MEAVPHLRFPLPRSVKVATKMSHHTNNYALAFYHVPGIASDAGIGDLETDEGLAFRDVLV